MANADSFVYRWSPVFLSTLRIVAGLLIMEHGTQKLFNFPPSAEPAGGPLPPLMVLGGWIEFGGGLLLVLGLLTRIAAFILSGEMAVAYFMFHATKSLYPIVNSGERAVIFCFVFLFLAVAGAGGWSIDAMRRKGGPTTTPGVA